MSVQLLRLIRDLPTAPCDLECCLRELCRTGLMCRTFFLYCDSGISEPRQSDDLPTKGIAALLDEDDKTPNGRYLRSSAKRDMRERKTA